ncbi:element excision factor XisH family protein [Dendronalium sp. ChiSLP03b]|uniref:element excision factor XisH family protein n=1 Tax=Dendronalium sp. ChiSLP03b TaxID=3075381 RepID=UPI003919739F
MNSYRDLKWKKSLSADLGIERLISAEKGFQRIVVEVKSFVRQSNVKDLEQVLGRMSLRKRETLAMAGCRSIGVWGVGEECCFASLISWF